MSRTTSHSATPTHAASTHPSTAASAPSHATITITSAMAFTGTMTVAPGAHVTVTNNDPASAHTLTATGGAFDTGNIESHSSKTFTAPMTPGRYAFVCQYHSFMTGTLVVV